MPVNQQLQNDVIASLNAQEPRVQIEIKEIEVELSRFWHRVESKRVLIKLSLVDQNGKVLWSFEPQYLPEKTTLVINDMRIVFDNQNLRVL